MRSRWFPVYRLIAGGLAPLAYRRLSGKDPQWRHRQPERRGQVAESGGELWLHAASVGELNAAEGLLRHWLANDPECRIVVSTLTATAAGEVANRFAGQPRLRHLFAPLDAAGCVGRWLDHTRPRALVLVETEIWPVLLDQCRRRGIPVAIVNGRISASAFRRYQYFAGLFSHALAGIAPILCQSQADRQRFRALGVPPAALAVTGNLKFDRQASDTQLPARWQTWKNRPAWVAGSTHEGEEAMLARAHRRLLERFPEALLVIVPRHPERAHRALESLQRAGLLAAIVGDGADHGIEKLQAVVVGRMGVLAGLYSVAAACFVGGSLIEGIGGHNLMEPALAGKPVLTGPFTGDQQQAADGLTDAGALTRVDSDEAVGQALTRLLDDRELARRQGARARDFAQRQRGALALTLERLEPLFSRARARSAGG
ncbi:MAG: 3-deoxy-D-manno-octulosonic acid transferase [Wenzhouxiangellaceae bacterium]|nr:3-deoxy-D-manno-octulosonic acid transferase [Wenzhouxiangellaceae bacterium]